MKTKILFITGLILFFAYGYSNNGELSKNGSTANNVNSPAECTPSGIADAETKESSTGIIIAYNKCPTYNSDSKIDKMRIGLYIKDTDTKEIFLATNLTDSKIAELLDAPVETLEIDLEVKLPATVPVAVSYRKAAANEQVEYPCFITGLWFSKYPNAIQIIVFDINRNHKTAKWKVKSLNRSGELANISFPKIVTYPDISIQIPDTIKGCITGNTFRNDIEADFEIKGNERINFKSYDATLDGEDDWGLAFKNNLLNTAKFNVSNNELVFKDSLDKPVIIFIPK